MVPHFEKMLYDNAPLLVNYVHAFQATGNELYRDVAAGIIHYVDEVLSDRDEGGFSASQDADVAFGDDGSYFTWTMADAKMALEKDEFDVIQLGYDVYEQGEMQHDPSQNVLFLSKLAEEVASLLNRPLEQVKALLNSGKKKLLHARHQKKPPFVDRTNFASWNGMMISAYLQAYKILDQENLLRQAERSLERILREHTREDGLISHRAVMLAKEAFLDDQVQIAESLLATFEVTGRGSYLALAKEIMLRTIEKFWDKGSGGFNDLPSNEQGLGVLALPFKSAQDSPTAAGNSVAARVLNRLFTLTEEPVFKEFAEKTLRHFAGAMREYGIFGATYFLALEQFLHPPLHVLVLTRNGDETGTTMHRQALKSYRYGMIVEKTDPGEKLTLPSAMKGITGSRLPVAYVCTSVSCAPPVYDPQQLERTIVEFGRKATASS